MNNQDKILFKSYKIVLHYYMEKFDSLTFEEVHKLFHSEAKCAPYAPITPEGGEVILNRVKNESDRDYLIDHYRFRMVGRKRYKLLDENFVKSYYGAQITFNRQTSSLFQKHIWLNESLKRVVLHYLGDEKHGVIEAPHGNRSKKILIIGLGRPL